MAEPTKHEKIVRAIGKVNLRDFYSPVEKEVMLLILDCLEEQYRSAVEPTVGKTRGMDDLDQLSYEVAYAALDYVNAKEEGETSLAIMRYDLLIAATKRLRDMRQEVCG